MISHILDHPAMLELDLSHNLIGDRGARAIGKFLNNHSKLIKLSVADNQIRGPGKCLLVSLNAWNYSQNVSLSFNRQLDACQASVSML